MGHPPGPLEELSKMAQEQGGFSMAFTPAWRGLSPTPGQGGERLNVHPFPS